MKEKISMIVFIIFLGTISAGLLVGINSYTTPKILKNKELKIKSSILAVLSIEYSKNEISETFAQNIEVIKKDNTVFYRSKNNEIVFEFSGSGLWGPISGVIALNPDLKTIKGIKITHQEETPGLGGRISEKEFLDGFKDKNIFQKSLAIVKGKASKDYEVDGITGATMTCKAFEDIINKNIKKFTELAK